MDIHRQRLVNLFRDDFIYDYTISRDILRDELIRSNTVLFILDRIRNSPLDIFFPFGSIFWSNVTDSLFDTCIMCMWRISKDGANNHGLTLRKFKNQILKNLCSKEIKDIFTNELKIQRFEKNVREIEEQLDDIRNNFIAHLNKQRYPLLAYKNILWDSSSVTALQKYQAELNQFFDILQFEEKYGLQYAEYSVSSNQHDNTYQPDADEFLDSIIRCSRVLNAIEKEPKYWEYVQEKLLSEEDVNIVIQYRAKFGLSNF